MVPVIVPEVPGSRTGSLLSEFVREQPVDLAVALELAVAVTAAVARFHAGGLVHRDLKPENVRVSLETGEAWLSGTSLALRAPVPGERGEPPEVIVGTLPYMAPEQTGRVNRSVDARADLYALGVILYELLTSRRPFVAADPAELLHSHVTRDPEPPVHHRGDIPPVLSRLVLKLLSKDAAGRYQTAQGLAADLSQCLTSWRAGGTIADFPLGTRDRPGRLAVPERLFGRDTVIAELRAAFDRVASTGAVELVLVAGYSGVGKSAVVQELKREVDPSRGVFCSGKFDERRGDVPYATLVDSLGDLVRRALGLPRAELDALRASIGASLGENAAVVCTLIPQLKSVLGPQPSVAELPAKESRLRLHRAIGGFLGAFARPGRPLVLFMDDLQWLDAATLDLLEHLTTRSETRNLLLLGAYRDNEVTPDHPLRTRLARIVEARARVQDISLGPLGPSDVGALLAAALRAAPASLAPLVDLVFAKTEGNPFFTVQLLSNLVEEGLLTQAEDEYSWNLDEIEARGVSAEVATLLSERITRLSRESQSVLAHLACLGTPANAATLAVVCSAGTEQIASALVEAMSAGLLASSGEAFHFAHDRIGETAYALIPADRRPGMHLDVARRLYDARGTAESDESAFAIVGQYNRAASNLSAAERVRVASLNLSAARRARAATAYASALTYANAGAGLLSDGDWGAHHTLAFALTLLQGECNLLAGSLGAAESQLKEASSRAGSPVELAAVTCLQVDLYTLLDRSDLGVDVALRYLASVGIEWESHPGRAHLDDEYGRFKAALSARGIESLAALPSMADPAVQGTMDVLTRLQVPAMFSDENLAGMVLARMANLSLAHGNSPGSCFAYGWLAGYAGAHLGDPASARKLANVAVELVERPELGRYRARVYCLVGYLVTPWIEHLRTGRPALFKANELARATGDVTFVSYSANHLITIGLGDGQHLEGLQRQAEAGLALAREFRFGLVADFFAGQLRLIRSLRGDGPPSPAGGPESEETEDELEARLSGDPLRAIAACWYWIRKLQAQYHAGEYRAAEASSASARSLLWTSTSDFELAEYHLYAAMTQAALAAVEPAEMRGPRLSAIRHHHERLRVWARGCPANFACREALIRAELAALEGDREAAVHAYGEAARGAQGSGFAHHEGLAFELASRFHAGCGDQALASSLRNLAADGYRRWGATALVTRLASDGVAPGRAPATGSAGLTVERLDLATVIAVSRSVSGEIELDRLVRTIITATAEHAGAQRVALVLPAGDELNVVAEASMDRGGPRIVLEPRSAAEAALPEAVLRYSARTGETVNLADAAQRRLFVDALPSDGRGRRSLLCLPLLVRGAVVGLLHLEHGSVPDAFTPRRIQLLGVIASQAAVALENARLYAELKSENAERRRAQEELSNSEERFRQFADALPEVVWITDLAPERVIYCSPSFERIWGYTVAELHERPRLWTDSIHPEDRERVDRMFSRWISGEADRYEDIVFRIVRPDGEIRWIREIGVASRTRDGVPYRVGGIAADITERRETEERLRRNEAHLSEAQRIARICSFDWMLTDGEVYWSDEARRILSYDARVPAPLEALLGRIHPDEKHELRRLFEHASLHGRDFDGEHRLLMPDGTTKHIHLLLSPTMDGAARVVALRGTIRDITERKSTEEANQRARTELANLNRLATMGELTASIAHEVNQPLSAIVASAAACTRWLGATPPNLEGARETLTRIVRDGRRAAEVIKRLRAMFQKSDLTREAIDVGETVRDVETFVRADLRRRRISLKVSVPDGLTSAWGSRVQVQQVMLNLVVNAVEAMEASETADHSLVISAAPGRPGFVEVSVSDSGCGLEEGSATRVFEAFYTTKETGMGLGLSISRSIVEAHGGAIWAVNNDGGGGATFRFTLPTPP